MLHEREDVRIYTYIILYILSTRKSEKSEVVLALFKFYPRRVYAVKSEVHGEQRLDV